MSRPVCAAKTCYNSYTKKPMIKFFPFPNDEVRSREWITNSGRYDLYKEPLNKITKHFLCSAHFEEKWFVNPKFKTKFKNNVEPVPTIFVNNLSEFLPKSIQSRIEDKITKLVSKENFNAARQDLDEFNESTGDAKSASEFGDSTSSHCKEEAILQCRLCASYIDDYQYRDIFNDDDPTLKEMFNYICPIKIEKDGLPRYVCNLCENKVKECYLCVKSFEEIYYYFKGVSDSQESNDVSEEASFNIGKEASNQSEEKDDRYVAATLNNNPDETVDVNADDVDADDAINHHSKIMYSEFGGDFRPDCESNFDCEESNVEHESNENNNKSVMLKCLSCVAEFNSQRSLKIHERQVHSVLNKKCNTCNKVVTAAKFKKHTMSHLPKENQCEYCGMQYRTKKRLESHLSMHEGDPFCSFCGKEFSNMTQKQSHERTHADTPRLLCELCGRIYFNQRVLDNHIKCHNKVGAISCDICSRSFSSESELKDHCDEYPTKFSCLICSKEFHLKSSVQQHMLTHSNEQPFMCSCGVSFNRKGNLSTHVKKFHRAVSSVESFKCSVCNRIMKSKLKLKWHMAKHTGNKLPYDCEYCEKRFGNIVKYKNHIRTHTGERPFVCSFCARTFNSRDVLRQHELIHQDIYPYQCSMCEQLFKRLHSFIIHKRTHTGERPYVCAICDKGFLQKTDLTKHLGSHSRRMRNMQLTNDHVVKKDALPEVSGLETVNIMPPLTTNAIEFCGVDDIVTLTNTELQLLNVPLVTFHPLMALSSNV